jgi:hypothetical protein
MLQRFLCCFRTSNIVPPDIRITNNEQPQKLITIIDKESYVSTEWLNSVDMKIDWKNTVEFVPPVEKGIVIKIYDGDTITIASKLPYPSSPLYRFSTFFFI